MWEAKKYAAIPFRRECLWFLFKYIFKYIFWNDEAWHYFMKEKMEYLFEEPRPFIISFRTDFGESFLHFKAMTGDFSLDN